MTGTTLNERQTKELNGSYNLHAPKGERITPEFMSELMSDLATPRPINTSVFGIKTSKYDLDIKINNMSHEELTKYIELHEFIPGMYNVCLKDPAEVPYKGNPVAVALDEAQYKEVAVDASLLNNTLKGTINKSDIHWRVEGVVEVEVEHDGYFLSEEVALAIGAKFYKGDGRYTVTPEDVLNHPEAFKDIQKEIDGILEKKLEEAKRKLLNELKHEASMAKQTKEGAIAYLEARDIDVKDLVLQMVYRENSGCRGTIRDVKASSHGKFEEPYDVCRVINKDALYPSWANVTVVEHYRFMTKEEQEEFKKTW